MRRGTLLTQVLLVNLLLIAAAVIAASIASNPENSLRDSASIGLVLGFALAATVAVNIWLLSRRFEPLQRLVTEMQTADLSKPPEPPARGYARLYAKEILGADQGCDFGFLKPQ